MDRNLVKQIGIGLVALVVMLTPLFVFAQNQGLVPCNGPDCTFVSVVTLINKVMQFLVYDVAVPISAVLFAWAGFLFLTSAGNSGQIEKAKGIFMNVFIGLVVALAAWLIVNLITTALTNKDANSFFSLALL
jgi:hypothetical protein